MKIVIDIPEDTWESVKRHYKQYDEVNALCAYVANGKPLSKIFENIKTVIEEKKRKVENDEWNYDSMKRIEAYIDVLGIIDEYDDEL